MPTRHFKNTRQEFVKREMFSWVKQKAKVPRNYVVTMDESEQKNLGGIVKDMMAIAKKSGDQHIEDQFESKVLDGPQKMAKKFKFTINPPMGENWPSVPDFVGLKNQGATCYMNSLLQVLYCLNSFRKCVFKIPTMDPNQSVELALQQVFYDLQFCDKAVDTFNLLQAIGWDPQDQQDVEEFLRILLDKLETKMKGTCVEGTIPKLFKGKMISYIQCQNVDYTSCSTESFYDIQLNVKGQKNIHKSFQTYMKTENLNGANQCNTPSDGLQDARKRIVFASFPPVLVLHLKRFEYDPKNNEPVKINDRFDFPETLDVSEFIKHQGAQDLPDFLDDYEDLSPEKPQSDNYQLFAVLTHKEKEELDGLDHYFSFIQMPNGQWVKFDDELVTTATAEEAVQNNFGGAEDGYSAYLLIYIRQSCLEDINCPVTEEDIPTDLIELLKPSCHDVTNVRKNLGAHRKRCESGELKKIDCFCGFEATSRNDYIKHVGKEHSNKKCDFCDFETPNLQLKNMLTHMKICKETKNKFECSLCQKANIKSKHPDAYKDAQREAKKRQRQKEKDSANVPDHPSKRVRIDDTFTMNFEIKEEPEEDVAHQSQESIKQEIKIES